MNFARIRKLLLLALAAGAVYWAYRTHFTASGFINGLTGPLFRSKAVVHESEHKRIVAQAAPDAAPEEVISVGMLREKMTPIDVRELIGPPDQIDEFVEGGILKVRWTYRRLGRVLVFQEGRVVSIAIR